MQLFGCYIKKEQQQNICNWCNMKTVDSIYKNMDKKLKGVIYNEA